jgi:hypothetical protein
VEAGCNNPKGKDPKGRPWQCRCSHHDCRELP